MLVLVAHGFGGADRHPRQDAGAASYLLQAQMNHIVARPKQGRCKIEVLRVPGSLRFVGCSELAVDVDRSDSAQYRQVQAPGRRWRIGQLEPDPVPSDAGEARPRLAPIVGRGLTRRALPGRIGARSIEEGTDP